MAGPYESMSEAANDRPKKGTMVGPEPEERLHSLVHDLTSEASILETEARELEDRMMVCRARAAGLRTAVAGLEAALARFGEQMDRMRALQKERDQPDDDRDANKSGFALRIPPEYR